MRWRILVVPLLLVGIVLSTGAASAADSKPSTASGKQSQQTTGTRAAMTGEEINWQVVAAGSSDASSTNFQLKATVGQTATGMGSSDNFGLSQGYWQSFLGGGGGCCQDRGNVDDIIGPAGPIDVSDLTYLVAYLFSGGPAPPCDEAGNVDAIIGPAGPIDVSDLTYLVAFLFSGGPAPPPC